MSLATLARKTKAKQRLRTRGNFILNMTGRGHVLGMNAKMSRGNCKGLTKCAGKRAACCVGVGGDEPGCCSFPHGGKPAPQMGYGVYLNRKSKGAYHPGGGPQCKKYDPGCKQAKTVWKQGANLDASVVITNKKDKVLACNSDVYTAKRDTCTGCSIPDMQMVVGLDLDNVQSNDTEGYIGYNTDFTYTPPASITPFPNNLGLVQGDSIICYYYNLNTPGNNELRVGNLNGDALNYTSTTTITFANNNSSVTYDVSTATSTNSYEIIFQDGAGSSEESSRHTFWKNAVGATIGIFINNPDGALCCCPVKKNICGCRATDLVRYTRINKSFGCQTTKAVRMGRSASEQIARNRAAVDCIKPKHRTIYMGVEYSTLKFSIDSCCAQCLIPGQQYTFIFDLPEVDSTNNYGLYIEWCSGLTQILLPIGNHSGQTLTVSLTVPKFNKFCLPASVAIFKLFGNSGTITQLPLDYCKQAFKRPQMLGSCSGR